VLREEEVISAVRRLQFSEELYRRREYCGSWQKKRRRSSRQIDVKDVDPISMAGAQFCCFSQRDAGAPFQKHQANSYHHVIFTCYSGIFSRVTAVSGLSAAALQTKVILPIGLPDLPFHLRLDALSGFFLYGYWPSSLSSSRYIPSDILKDTSGSVL